MSAQPNRQCARQAAEVLRTVTNPDEGLAMIIRCVANCYGPEIAASFADLIVEELRDLDQVTVH